MLRMLEDRLSVCSLLPGIGDSLEISHSAESMPW